MSAIPTGGGQYLVPAGYAADGSPVFKMSDEPPTVPVDPTPDPTTDAAPAAGGVAPVPPQPAADGDDPRDEAARMFDAARQQGASYAEAAADAMSAIFAAANAGDERVVHNPSAVERGHTIGRGRW